MKQHINKHGATINLGDTVNFKGKRFIVKRLYRDKLGVAKIETCEGVIFDADRFTKASA